MKGNRDKMFKCVGLVLSLILVIGIFKMHNSSKEKSWEEFRQEQERIAEENQSKEDLEEFKNRDIDIKPIDKRIKTEEVKVPAPEVVKTTDESGNTITEIQVPKTDPKALSPETERPVKKITPTKPPKELPNAKIVKEPTSAKDTNENSGTYPNTKAEEKPQEETTGKTGNPFLDAPPTQLHSSRSEDLGGEGIPEAGKGDKF